MNVGCPWTFLDLPDLKLDLLAVFERGISIGFNIRVVNKQVFSTSPEIIHRSRLIN